MSKLSIESQIAEMEYVLEAVRKFHHYSVNARHIKREVADLHEQHELAILDTLRWFATQQDFIREMFKVKKEAKDATDGRGMDR